MQTSSRSMAYFPKEVYPVNLQWLHLSQSCLECDWDTVWELVTPGKDASFTPTEVFVLKEALRLGQIQEAFRAAQPLYAERGLYLHLIALFCPYLPIDAATERRINQDLDAIYSSIEDVEYF